MPTYPILLPPVWFNGKVLNAPSIELDERKALPLIQIGVLGKPTGEEPTPTPEPELVEQQPTEPEPVTEAVPDPSLVNLNTASLDALKELPYIGAAIAKKLVTARPFATFDEAYEASELSEAKWAEIEPLTTL